MQEVSSKVWLEHETGPREILPESLWTGLTRNSIGVPTWQGSLQRATGKFAMSESGVWLPNQQDSESDLLNLQNELSRSPNALLIDEEQADKLREISFAVDVTASGCWQADSVDAVIPLAEVDIKSTVLEQSQHLGQVRHCQNIGCVYHRHYDLTLGVPSGRRSLLYPNLEHFQTDMHGRVITSWGDSLPQVDQSRQELRHFQKQCIPFVERDKSLLTALHISQISLLPTTGCWFANNYYMTPVGVNGYENWQYDGYSRLRIPSAISEKYHYRNFALLGHRVIWLLSGNSLPDPKQLVINHRCGFRPCVNPGHLEEISPQANGLHGRMMLTASNMLSGNLNIESGLDQLKYYAQLLGIDPAPLKGFWNDKLDSIAQRA